MLSPQNKRHSQNDRCNSVKLRPYPLKKKAPTSHHPSFFFATDHVILQLGAVAVSTRISFIAAHTIPLSPMSVPANAIANIPMALLSWEGSECPEEDCLDIIICLFTEKEAFELIIIKVLQLAEESLLSKKDK